MRGLSSPNNIVRVTECGGEMFVKMFDVLALCETKFNSIGESEFGLASGRN